MSRFDFEEKHGPAKRSGPKLFWFFAGCIAMATLGTSIAAQINLNNNGNVEFGQGILQTTLCDSSGVLVTPINSFANETQGGAFIFNAIQVTKIDATCAGVDFILKAYDGNGELVALTEGDEGDLYAARVRFNLLEGVLVGGPDSGPNVVSEYGYWAEQFTSTNEGPFITGSLHNLVKKDSVGDPEIGDSANDYFDFDAGDNGFQISFNPSSQIMSGFADSKNVYRITLETTSRQS